MIACTLFLPIFTAAKDEKYFSLHFLQRILKATAFLPHDTTEPMPVRSCVIKSHMAKYKTRKTILGLTEIYFSPNGHCVEMTCCWEKFRTSCRIFTKIIQTSFEIRDTFIQTFRIFNSWINNCQACRRRYRWAHQTLS